MATGHPPFENPKVHKLARLESKSRGSLFWATDSNVRVAPDTLRRLVDEHLAHDAKVVFSPIRGSSSRTFGSLMENAGLNFFTSGSVIAAWFLGRQAIIVGKSMLVEREALETFGGFGYFKDYLAEDFLLGEAFAKSGFRVSTNCTWVTNVSQTATLKSFFKRLSRWAKLRYHLRRPVYLSEILLNPIVIALAGAAVFGRRGWAVVAVTAAAQGRPRVRELPLRQPRGPAPAQEPSPVPGRRRGQGPPPLRRLPHPVLQPSGRVAGRPDRDRQEHLDPHPRQRG